MNISEAFNAKYIDEQYRRWKKNPDRVSSDWQYFFKGFEMAGAGQATPSGTDDLTEAKLQAKFETLVFRYREIGHLLACMDPLSECPNEHPLLTLDAFGFSSEDLDRYFATPQLQWAGKITLKEAVQLLKETYSRSIGVEYMHLQDPDERQWLQDHMEPVRNRPKTDPQEQRHILRKLLESTLFESFLNKKYVGVTRFSLEGGDAVIPLLDTVAGHSARLGCGEIILGMAHRGRLNVQTHVLKRPYEEIFAEFESCYDPDQLMGAGDVKYHNGFLTEIETSAGHPLRMYLASNPSHLEAVNPVVEGIARARQDRLPESGRGQVVPVLLHGDAAFAGQGVVAETLNMSQLTGYATGGTIHIVINNQIGYTTLPADARSTRYSTDVAKMLMVPIFHVHGEDPEAVVHAARVAVEYRYRFGKDVILDVICYRRYGHNEGDEPYFTQPQMYDRIKSRPPLSELYAENLLREGAVETGFVEEQTREIEQALESAYEAIHGSACLFPEHRYFEGWQEIRSSYSHEPVQTSVAENDLLRLGKVLNTVPGGFTPHPKITLLLKKRMQAVKEGKGIDWANAEALAFASLVSEGFPVRLSGQDCGRGTFSQRHSVLTDRKTGEIYIPLNTVSADQAPYKVYNSLLAEAGVMGFEYGYSTVQPRGLVMWEAQFGDFANNAQGIIDLFIASGQSKWQRLSGLVLLLPHGWEGLGPEHSSARLERFLQLCAEDNMLVCNPSTPAQYFHLLRRQVKAGYRKPLVVMTPKSLLRHPLAVSERKELSGSFFQTVLDDPAGSVPPKRVLFCSGKIFYQLLQRREEVNRTDIAIVRLEQFYPFPTDALKEVVARSRKVEDWVWVQEEPRNMGGWQFVRPWLEEVVGGAVRYVGRRPAASPATGFPTVYKKEQAAISDEAVGPFPG